MSSRDHTRSCPSCERELSGREHFGEGGLTVIWKCICGWGSARTIPASQGAMDLGIRKSSGVRQRPVAEGDLGSPSNESSAADRTKTRTGDG